MRAKSVFHFDVPGSVAESTQAALPWLRLIRRLRLGARVHFWPFDGWDFPAATRSRRSDLVNSDYSRPGRHPSI